MTQPGIAARRGAAWALLAVTAFGVGTIVASALGLLGLDQDYGVSLTLVGVCKVIVLGFGSWVATLCALRIRSRSWGLMAAGLWLYTAGQSALAYAQLSENEGVVFPSPADVFFLVGMLSLALALGSFQIDLRRSGFPVELRRLLPGSLALAFGIGGPACWLALRPLFPIETMDSATFLSILYPLADLFLLVPVVLLFRVSSLFQGGGIRRVWMVLLAGFVLMLLGDVAFALFLNGSSILLGALVDGFYLIGYALVPWACLIQLELVD